MNKRCFSPTIQLNAVHSKCYIAQSFCKLFARLTFELWLAFSNNGPLIIIIIMMFALKCCILITLFCFEWWFTVRLLSNYIAIWTNCGILPAATVQRLLLTTTTQKEEPTLQGRQRLLLLLWERWIRLSSICTTNKSHHPSEATGLQGPSAIAMTLAHNDEIALCLCMCTLLCVCVSVMWAQPSLLCVF